MRGRDCEFAERVRILLLTRKSGKARDQEERYCDARE